MENSLKVYKSDKFDVEDTASLSLFLYPRSILIFAKDKRQNNIAVHHYADSKWKKFSNLLANDPLLRVDAPTKVYLHHSHFSLVPGAFFHPGAESEYLRYSGDIPPPSPDYFSTPLDGHNLHVASYVPSRLKNSLEIRFSELDFFHGACSFLSYLFKERFNLIGQEILVSYMETHSYIAAFTDQDLGVFNMFETKKKDDILKYVLIIAKQMNYDHNLFRVSIIGADESSGITQEWGELHFSNFRLVQPYANQNYSQGLNHLQSQNVLELSWQYD